MSLFKSALRIRIENKILELYELRLNAALEAGKRNNSLNPEERIKFILKKAKYDEHI